MKKLLQCLNMYGFVTTDQPFFRACKSPDLPGVVKSKGSF